MPGRVVRAKSLSSTLGLYSPAPPSVPSHLIGACFMLQVLGLLLPLWGPPGFPLEAKLLLQKPIQHVWELKGTFNMLGEESIKYGVRVGGSFEVREGQTGSISPMAVEVSCL